MDSVFLDACKRKETDYTPVWFMRQAGRYMKSYREIKGPRSIIDLAKDPETSSQLVVDAVNELGVDAAIIFADIIIPAYGTGFPIRIDENVGPVTDKPIMASDDLMLLKTFDAEEHAPYVLDGIAKTKEKLNGSVPLIGFCGAPFTLASYLVNGSPTKDYTAIKRFMSEQTDLWNELMGTLTDMSINYLSAQIDFGVDAIQVFDSWAGFLSQDEYRKFVFDYTRRIFTALPEGIPKIHFCSNSSVLLEDFAKTGCTVLSVDSKVNIGDAFSRTNSRLAIQGNLDPNDAVVGGSELSGKVKGILESAFGNRGHIFNLGHGVLPQTPVENLKTVVEEVHGHKKR